MHFNVLSPLVKSILGKKNIYFSIGSLYVAISVFLSILYVDWLACGLGSFYPGGDKMQISGDSIVNPQNGTLSEQQKIHIK